MSVIEQGLVIERLNQYLEWHNLPFKMNRSGICLGLSLVFARYSLEGRSREFFELLEAITDKKLNEDMEEKVNIFAAELAFSFSPGLYNKDLSQSTSYKTQKIDGKPLNNAFNIGLATSDSNWADIFLKLDLREDEVLVTSSTSHAVSVVKKNGKYRIYDPNYDHGVKLFKDEKSLIKELRKQVVFDTKSSFAGLQLTLLSHPGKPVRDLGHFNAQHIYQNYRHEINSTLFMASYLGDQESIETLMTMPGLDDLSLKKAAGNAVRQVNQPAVLTMVKRIDSEEDLKFLIDTSIASGKRDIFNGLLEVPKVKQVFDAMITTDSSSFENFICLAAYGGNAVLLKDILERFEHLSSNITVTPALEVADAILKSNAISMSISGGNPACLNLLLKYKEHYAQDLTASYNIHCLLEAIRYNQPLMVRALIQDFSKEQIDSIHMHVNVIKKTDIGVLKILKEHGKQFSALENAVIQKKESHIPIGLINSIGIALKKFSDFCNEVLFKQKSIAVDIRFYKEACKPPPAEDLSVLDQQYGFK